MDELPRALARGLSSLYVIHGDEALLALEAAQLIRDSARVAGYTEREVLTVETGFDWSRLAMSGNSFSLFAEKKMIDLRIPTGKPGVEGAKTLEAQARDLPPDTLILITLPKLDRTGLNSKWFSALAGAGEVIEARTIERNQLPDWINSRLARQKQRMEPEALAFLADRVEGNLLAAHQEIQKFALLYPEGMLALEDVQAAITNVARYDVFQLGAALLEGDRARFARMLDGLRAEGEAPHLVLWALAEELRTLYRIGKGCSENVPLFQLFKDHRVWGEKQKLVERALPRITAGKLRKALAHAARIDELNKGIGEGEVWDELLDLALPLMH
ncbi:MAG: DNA polymerase III subunit delta [Formivibrio sp.]|nr:DNA polymerase III subunit delta [Formivibrio sp.]